jgi:hypothetical protein
MTRTRRLTALCLTIAAIAPAAAQAYPLSDGPSGADPDLAAVDTVPARAIVVSGSDGIDWADAGAGFAAAACLSLLAVGTMVGFRAPRRDA